MGMTLDEFWEWIRVRIKSLVSETLREEGVYNELMWLDGKIDVVSADGKTADVFINGATTSTKAIPIANGLLVAVNDEVIVLNRSKMRDMVVKYRKTTATGPENIISAFRAYQSTAQSITAVTMTKVQYQTKVFDNQSEYDPSTNYRFTAKKAGIYLVSASVNTSGATSGSQLILTIYKNGTEDTRFFQNSSSNGVLPSGSAMVKLNAGDYIEIYSYSSVAVTTTVTNPVMCVFEITKIA